MGLQRRRLHLSRRRQRGRRRFPPRRCLANPADSYVGRNCAAIAKGQGEMTFFGIRAVGRLRRLLTGLEREEDLLVLALRFAAPADLGAPPAEAACRVVCAT